MKQIILRFGLLAVALVLLMQLAQYSLATRSFSDEWMVALFAVLFVSLGYIVSRVIKTKVPIPSTPPTPSSPPPTPPLVIKEDKLKSLGISKREYEVLQLIAQGNSNQEIAQQLFISESTVKTHVSNLLQKLDAKRRTQAVKTAKELEIL